MTSAWDLIPFEIVVKDGRSQIAGEHEADGGYIAIEETDSIIACVFCGSIVCPNGSRSFLWQKADECSVVKLFLAISDSSDGGFIVADEATHLGGVIVLQPDDYHVYAPLDASINTICPTTYGMVVEAA
jgi:hypothetical protein